MSMTEQSCAAFAEALASKAPVPGGGGAAALCGALGVALCSMVGNLTLGRKKYAAYEKDLQAILAKAGPLRARLLQLVEEDALNFEPLAKAYAIPKDDPDRAAVLERVTLDACKAPLEMMECCGSAVELLEEMLDKGSVTLVSDVGCGALCCAAALESASLNVFVNTRTLQNRKTAAEMDAHADALLRVYLPRARRVADETADRLRKEA